MSGSIKVYKIKSFAFTPFSNEKDLDYLGKQGIQITENIFDADVLVSQNYKHLKKYFPFFLFKKKFLVWTLEPRFDTSFDSFRNLMGGAFRCHFMNVYTKDVFTTGLTFHAGIINKKLQPLPSEFKLTNRKVVALMSYFKGLEAPVLEKDGEDIDLIKLRTKIALTGYELGRLDIFGRDWPEGIVVENSRRGNWKKRKLEILQPYNFNLCFENTIIPNYITEKIWDSIESYSLPIYYGQGNNIYELFPTESFIDYSQFQDPKELFDFIHNMDSEEFMERMNKCIEVYNRIAEKGSNYVWEQRKRSLDEIVKKLNTIT